MSPTPHAPRTGLPAQPPLVLFWARFHAMRALRRPATALWLVGAALLCVALRVVGEMPGDRLLDLVLAGVLPLMAMLQGSGGVREEVEDQTLTYAFTRPVDRGWIFVARVLSAAMLVAIPTTIGVVLAMRSPLQLPIDLVVALVATLMYTAVFAVVGLMLRRPTMVGLVILGWEQIASAVPGFLSRMTLRTHVRGLLDLGGGSGPLGLAIRPPPWWASLPVLVVVCLGALALGVWWARHRELVVPK